MSIPSAEIGDVLTPTMRVFLRRSLFWIGITTIIVIIAAVGISASQSADAGESLAADSAAPAGAKALVEVLGREGVAVTATASLPDTRESITDPEQTTLLVYDFYFNLDLDKYRQILTLADTVILIQPNAEALSLVSPDIYPAGFVGDGELRAGCALPAAQAAQTISGYGAGYRVTDGASDVTTCFDSGDDVRSLVQVERADSTVTIFGAGEALSNGVILENGNAALALQLLGSHPNLIWYLPGIADYGVTELTVAELSPDWVQPVALTLFLTFFAAAIWRGRRFGPLIIENLPVTVRASETMLGRSRLYQQNSARSHALDSLRIGTISRLATLCGLSRTATVEEVVAAVAAITRTDIAEVRRVLIDAVPHGDTELVALSDRLLTLERETARHVRPE